MSRPRPPLSLKRRFLPIWNRSHRAAWRVGEYLGAIRHGRFGRCDVCGRFGPWLYRRRLVSSKLQELWELTPKLAEALARKESLDCIYCGAKLRARRLSRVLLDLYPVGRPPAPSPSIADWVRKPESQSLRVAEINLIEGLHACLSELSTLAFSDFDPDGSRAGVRSEDLTRLTYPDASFDLVVTSETLEHVPDLRKALKEIHRVLAPGGRHVFTVPVLPGVPKTFARMALRPDGALERSHREIRHPGGDVGYPVFTEFGADFPGLLEQAGFEVAVAFGPVSDDDLAQVYVCRKPQ